MTLASWMQTDLLHLHDPLSLGGRRRLQEVRRHVVRRLRRRREAHDGRWLAASRKSGTSLLCVNSYGSQLLS
jgi:hypothetical protein